MKKRLWTCILAITVILSMAACGKTKTVHCDHCDKALTVAEDSNMTEDWIIYCHDCEVELGLDHLVEEFKE